MTKKTVDPNPEYWDSYTPFQAAKHAIIRHYLNGWYPKLGYWSGHVLYVETHAGRGKYATGALGSPLIALRTLIDHTALPSMLKKSEFNFLFLERDHANHAALKQEVDSFSTLPKGINVETAETDAFDEMSRVLKELRDQGKQIAPAFIFVDPYGFKIPTKLLRELMDAGRVELFINIMWRELDMLVCQRPVAGTSHAKVLDDVFASGAWRTRIIGGDVDERLNQAIPLLAEATGAKWWTSAVRMVTGGSATRYLLLHLTNSDDGRDLMKECCWKVAPDGDFVARKSENPDQQFLFEREADLGPLRSWVTAQLKLRPHRWQELHTAVRPEWWLKTQVNEVVRALKAEGAITNDLVPGKSAALSFKISANPILRLVQSRNAESSV